MLFSFIIQLTSIIALFFLATSSIDEVLSGDLSAAKTHAIIFSILFIFLAIYRAHRRNMRKARKIKVQKWVGKVCAEAHSAINRKSFNCLQCHKWKPTKEAELIAVYHEEEEEYSEKTGDYKTKKTHNFGGFVCKKCAKIVRTCSNEETSYIGIPKELRK